MNHMLPINDCLHTSGDKILQGSLFAEKSSMVVAQTACILAAAKFALEAISTSFASVTGSQFFANGVTWVSSSMLGVNLGLILVHVFSAAIFILLVATLTKCLASALMDRQITWENWRWMPMN